MSVTCNRILYSSYMCDNILTQQYVIVCDYVVIQQYVIECDVITLSTLLIKYNNNKLLFCLFVIITCVNNRSYVCDITLYVSTICLMFVPLHYMCQQYALCF